ncbi:MAG: ribosome maturation factor RimM [Chitinophagales bacterium]
MKNFRNIGKLVSVFGLQGEFILQHHLGKKSSLKGLDAIFLEEKKDELIPYFVSFTKIKSEEEIFLKLEGIDSKENARRFLQKEVWMREEDFVKFASKSAPISWVGYHLIDQGNDLGEILEVIEQPQQILCRIFWKEKELLIPVTSLNLEKTDRKNKKVFVMIPEGLLDFYLES